MLYLSINNNFRNIVLFCSTLTMSLTFYNTVAAITCHGIAVFRRRAAKKAEKQERLACEAPTDEESTLKGTNPDLDKKSTKSQSETKSGESAEWI
jgi:hypothetical protein